MISRGVPEGSVTLKYTENKGKASVRNKYNRRVDVAILRLFFFAIT